MAWSHEAPGAALVEERAERAWRLPVGAVSPLWAVFGAAAGAGVAYWWMTRWTRALNVEALAGLIANSAATAGPIEVLAEPAAVPLAEEPAAAPVSEPMRAAEAAAESPAAEPGPDDLTQMTGIGPKLSAALARRGVTRFAQIAAWTEADLAEVDAALSLKGRAVREAWVAQAKRLAE
ncbi:MAG TPA: hypothetical protein VMT68_16275 [Caulobacteraceae bacterium]|nr:hypothetical protein [Caulobacteraceae bacterium]